MYPFKFHFEIGYSATGTHHSKSASLSPIRVNDVLPASMGAHPAFRWPLSPGMAKEACSLTFAAEETAPLRGVVNGLLTEQDRPSPINGRHLPLNEALFAQDALILPEPRQPVREVRRRRWASANPRLGRTSPNLASGHALAAISSASSRGAAWQARPSSTATSPKSPGLCSSQPVKAVRRACASRCRHNAGRVIGMIRPG